MGSDHQYEVFVEEQFSDVNTYFQYYFLNISYYF